MSQHRTPASLVGSGRLAASLRLAVVLLVLLAIACFVGIVLSQPASFQAERYLSRRFGASATAVPDFVKLARAAGIRVGGETYAQFSARLEHKGVEEEDEREQQFFSAFVDSLRQDEESLNSLRLFYVDEYGETAGGILLALQIHHVFSSLWFRLLCVLLIVNVVACSTQRLGGQWRAAFGLRPPKEPAWYARRAIHGRLALASSVDDATDRAAAALREGGFRVTRRRSTGAATLDAARGWLGGLGRFWWPLGRIAGAGRLGAQVVHLGIILIILGGFVSGRLGFRHMELMAPGEVVAVPDVSSRAALGRQVALAWHDLRAIVQPSLKPIEDETARLAAADWRVGKGEEAQAPLFRMGLRSFSVRFDVAGRPEYYGARVALLDREPPAEQVIEVNRPLVYRGYYVYQNSYQPDEGRVTSVSFLVYEMSGEQSAAGHFHAAAPEGEVQRQISVVAKPGVAMPVPGTGLSLEILRYFSHCQVPLVVGPDGRERAGPPRDDSPEPNPAVAVRLQAQGLPASERLVFLPVQPGQPRNTSSYGRYLLGAIDYTPGYDTVLEFKTHPVMLPVWIGCAVVMLGIVLCFYCNHQRVWVLIVPRAGGAAAEPREGEAPAEAREGEASAEPPWEGEAPAEPHCDVHLAGDSFKWRERFKERFEAIVNQL